MNDAPLPTCPTDNVLPSCFTTCEELTTIFPEGVELSSVHAPEKFGRVCADRIAARPAAERIRPTHWVIRIDTSMAHQRFQPDGTNNCETARILASPRHRVDLGKIRLLDGVNPGPNPRSNLEISRTGGRGTVK
jgi:hypothetical protein